MRQISFIHAADLHLDSPMIGLKYLPAKILTRLRESTFTALQKITKTAIEKQVDFVILAGDLFDGEDRSLRAQSRFRSEMQKLEQKHIPVFVVHGNHDHLNGSWVHLEMPANVHFFKSTVEMKKFITKKGTSVHLYGFSYPERRVYEKKIEQYQKKESADFHIGILHGNEGGRADHDNYAPFTVRDLQDKQFDYWALGHIHKRSILSESPPIIYPGNIQGRNRKETGQKGCYHVILNEVEPTLEFIETADVIWEEITINTAGADSFQNILQLCRSEINRIRHTQKGTLLTLNLQNVYLADQREKSTLDGELLDLLVDFEENEDSFVWVIKLAVDESQNIERDQLKTETNFYEELFNTIDEFQNVEEALSPLYQHQTGRKYLSALSEEEQKALLVKAEKLLINLLHK